MTYQTEFPDYDPATMPAIPADWRDTSWVNEPCPCFAYKGLSIFIDYADPAMREFPETERFSVHDLSAEDGKDPVLYYGDDWAAVLEFIAKYDTAHILPALLPAERGRYSVYAQDQAGTFEGRTDDLDGAAEILAREFRASRWSNRFAMAAIYDGQAMRYVWAWHAGDRHTVKDTRHLLEVIFTKALKSGRDVALIG